MKSIRPATAALIVIGAQVGLQLPAAQADNKHLNDSVAVNVFTLQHQAGCRSDIKVNPPLRLAAQNHALDLLSNRALNADVGSDGSTPHDRAEAAGFHGKVAETVAINQSLAINALDVMNQWVYDPADKAIMVDCANTAIGVWSENSLDRSVVVAVYGAPG